MKKPIAELDSDIASGKLASLGYLDATILMKFRQIHSSSLISAFEEIAKSLQWGTKKSKQAAVFRTVSLLQGMIGPQQLEDVSPIKRTCLTCLLTKLLIPIREHRNHLNEIRLKVLKQLKEQQKAESEGLELLNELYVILTFGQESLMLKDAQKLKKALISLKRMMGNDRVIEEDQRKDKKKAYQDNIKIREIIQYCLQNVESTDLKEKVNKLLSSPKDKKWFGIRLYKLLEESHWSHQQKMMLVQQIKRIKNLDRVGEIKMRYLRPKLNKIESNIIRHMQKNQDLQTIKDIPQKRRQNNEMNQCFKDNEFGENSLDNLFELPFETIEYFLINDLN